ncbi:MAG: hypothetical protein ACAI38_21625 [Myxococcota bacterium]
MVLRRRPGGCWLPSPSTPTKREEAKRRKTVGDVDRPAAKPEPGMRKVDDKLLAKDIGKLVDDVSVYEGVAKRKMESIKALNKLAGQIGADPEAPGGGSLTVDTFKAVTAKRAVAMLCNAENSRMDESSREGDNVRLYTKGEATKIVDHLLAQAGRGGKLYVAEWDDISSEYIGLMLAAVKPDQVQATFGQVISFRP